MRKAVVIISGGMDSATLLAKVIADGYEVYPLTFNYGQRHGAKEMSAARLTIERLEVLGKVKAENYKVVDITNINQLLQGSALTSDIAVPEGHYAQENMKLTVVPNRNMIMLSLATGYAVSKGAEDVFFGAHSGDHAIYPDCRKEFIEALNQSTAIANYQPVTIRAPFIDMDKGDIAILGLKLGVDYALTWTCYVGGNAPCGKCGACVERAEAFAKAGVKDPLTAI